MRSHLPASGGGPQEIRSAFAVLPPRVGARVGKQYFDSHLPVISQQAQSVGLLWNVIRDMDCLLRSPETMSLLPYYEENYKWKFMNDAHSESTHASGNMDDSKDRLPVLHMNEQDKPPKFCFQLIRHLVLNTSPRLMEASAGDLGAIPSTSADGITRHNLEIIEELLWSERKTRLEVDWWRLERLETLFIDIRSYGCSFVNSIDADGLYEMAEPLKGKQASQASCLGRAQILPAISWRRAPEYRGRRDGENGFVWGPEGSLHRWSQLVAGRSGRGQAGREAGVC